MAAAAAGAVLAAALAGAACVSLPHPAGPVRVEGPVPSPGDSGTAGAPQTRVAQGPLLLREAILENRDYADYEWTVELVNPSDTTFDTSLVVTLLDAGDSPVGSSVRDLRIAGGETTKLSGSLAASARPTRFRIEYWVRLLPPPERRVERVGP